jgi:nitroimidazol reductase NimA-like FMN-containing flavoprotein (pyridoxamine 5'-phosphate oxidase superfamily)
MFRKLVRIKQQMPMEDCIELLKNETRGVLSVLGDDDYPYGAPINHYYDEENGKIYFHIGSQRSHRTDAVKKHDKVSFCVYDEGFKNDGEWALNISSVIVFGKMRVVEDSEKAIEIYRKLSLKFTSDIDYIDSEIKKLAKATLCYELKPEHITGKIVNEA